MHIIATSTYGFEKVNDPSLKKKVSALKIGAAVQAKILTTLFGSNVRDLSTPRHSYHYLAFNQRTQLTHGFLVLRVTDAELAAVQNITLTAADNYNRTYLWRDHGWYEFPNRRSIEYKKVEHYTGSSTPRFSGDSAFYITTQVDITSDQEPMGISRSGKHQVSTVYKGAQITATKKGDWWWFSGTLTSNDESVLWKAGARFSQKRRQFYLISDDLSDDILQKVIGISRIPIEIPTPSTPVFYLDNLTDEQLLIAQRSGAKQDPTGRWYFDQDTMAASFDSLTQNDPVEALNQAEMPPTLSTSDETITSAPMNAIPNVMQSLIATFNGENNPALAVHRLEVLPDVLLELLPERPLAEGDEHLALIEIFVPSNPPSYIYITHRTTHKNSVVGYNLLDNPLVGQHGRHVYTAEQLRTVQSATDQKLKRFTSFKPQTLTQVINELISTQADIYGQIDLHNYPVDLSKISRPVTSVTDENAAQLANSGDLTVSERQNWQQALRTAKSKNAVLDPALLLMLPVNDARYDSRNRPIAFVELFLFSSKPDYLFITEYDPTAQRVMAYNAREGAFGTRGWNWHDIAELQDVQSNSNTVQQSENFTPAAINDALATLPRVILETLNLNEIEPYKIGPTNTVTKLPEPIQPPDDNGLTLFPQWLLDARPIGDQLKTADGKRLVFAKLFHPYLNWYLFVSDYNEELREVYCYAIMNNDFDCAEWGWQSVDDLEQMKIAPGSRGLPMERDISFRTMPIDDAVAWYKHDHGLGPRPGNSTKPESAATSASTTTPTSIPSAGSLPDVTSTEPKEIAPLKLPIVELEPVPADLELPRNKVFIPQQYIGDIYETGTSYCFGFAIDRRSPSFQNRPIYLSIVGAATSVDAVWAKLALGKEIVVSCQDKTSVSLIPDGKGKYKRVMRRLEELSLVHVILIHEDLAEPSFGDKEHPTAYVLATTPEIKRAKIIEYINKSVTVPIFDNYADYLIEHGYQRGLIRDCQSVVVSLVAITTDTGRWIDVISEGLRSGKLKFPLSQTP